MINPEIEELLTLEEAARLPWLPRPRRGKRIAVSSIWRWCVHGVAEEKLDSLFLGGRIYTSAEAIKRFMRAVKPRTLRSPRRNQAAEFPSDRSLSRGPIAAEAEASRLGF
jgi:uncharacterized protein DUF1580